MSRDDGPDSLPSNPAPGLPNGDRPGQDPATRTKCEGETLELPEGMGALSKGQALGER